MKKYARITTAVVAALVTAPLAACSSSDPEPEAEMPTVTPIEVAETEAPEELPRSERGNLIKEVGEKAGIEYDRPGQNEIDFTIQAITPDPSCSAEYAQAPENGHFFRIDMDLVSTPEFDDHFVIAEQGAWKWIDANGTTANADPVSVAGMMCLAQNEQLPQYMGTGEKVTGSVVLDLPTTEGTLVFEPVYGLGWEWEVPAV